MYLKLYNYIRRQCTCFSMKHTVETRWGDQRKYFELSEVRIKHRVSTILFMSIEVEFLTCRVMLHTSYDVADALYNWFCAFLRMLKHEIHKGFETLYVYCNYYSRNNKTYNYHSVSTHCIHVTVIESDINRTRTTNVYMNLVMQLMNKLRRRNDSN